MGDRDLLGGTTERPGEFPFTRGDEAGGPDPAGWFATYYSGAGTAADTNSLFRERFAQADEVPSLLLAMDLPTQVGLDPDDELAIGEVGRIGVAVSSLDDVLTLFDGIGLGAVKTGTVGNAIGIWTCPLFEVAGRHAGVRPEQMRITLQNDPLKEYTGRGTQIFPAVTAVELSIDVVEHVHRNLGAGWKPQYTCSTQMRWGGVDAGQEIGFGLANMATYVDAAARRGIEPAAYLSRTDLHMSADEDLIGEVAKFRAARRAWALLVERRYGRETAERSPLRITVFTAGNRLTAQRPLNNIVRTTTHVLACMLGGVHEILVPGYDEALGLPTREATALTNATKQILFEETGIGSSADPLGGSVELERRTAELTEEALHWFAHIEEMGGMLRAIEDGYIREEMTEGTHRRQREIESGERHIVGLNYGDTAPAPPLEIFEASADAEAEQIRRVVAVRGRRSAAEVRRSLDALARAAERKLEDPCTNLVTAVGDCIEARATVGEIFADLRAVLGEAGAAAPAAVGKV
jgi:methylmalonyl-CoA mutase N-terminal domain/subunit